MTEKEGLSSGEISRMVTSQVDEVKKILKDADYSEEDLEDLKEAEKNGKDRKTVLNLIDGKEKQLKVEEDLEGAEEGIEGLEEILEQLEAHEGLELDDKDEETIEQDKLIEILGMNIDEMKSYIRSNELSKESLEQVLEGEKKIKKRETAKEFLERKIKERKLEKDARKTEKDLENLRDDVEDFEEDEDLGKLSKQLLESETTEDEEKEKSNTKVEQKEDSNGEEEEEPNEAEKKQEILEGLEIDISEEKLQKMSLEDLEELKNEKQHREDMISDLEDEGLKREDLEKATTGDLEKLHEQVENQEDSSDEKSKEEIREEAEEDLQMLMGAGKGDADDTEEDSDPREQAEERIEKFKTSITQKFSRDDQDKESEDSSLNQGSVKEKLESYKDLGERESAVKTAHIMKGYLEYRLNIEREMTYDELADNLPTEEYEGMDTLAGFFRQMQEDEYTQNIRVDSMEDILDACRKVVDRLEG